MPAGYGSSKDSLAGGRGASDNANGRAGGSGRSGGSNGGGGSKGPGGPNGPNSGPSKTGWGGFTFGGGRPSYTNGNYPGLTTGTVMHGNTAYGQAGYMADGYATQSPATGEYSNFVGYNGGLLGTNPFGSSHNPNTAFGRLAMAYEAQRRGR